MTGQRQSIMLQDILLLDSLPLRSLELDLKSEEGGSV